MPITDLITDGGADDVTVGALHHTEGDVLDRELALRTIRHPRSGIGLAFVSHGT